MPIGTSLITRRGAITRLLGSLIPLASVGQGTTFENVAKSAGLTRQTIFGGKTQNKYILETTGCGAAFFDYDADGWLDILLVNGRTLEGTTPSATLRLYRNNRDGTFRDVTAGSGLERTGWGQAVCIGDFDNDGFDDLFITYYGQNVLYRNNGNGTFTDVTRAAGLLSDNVRWGAGCAFLDYDSDGWLDLFVTNYVDFDFKTAPLPGSASCMFQGMPVNCGPRGLPKARNFLFRNNRDGTFTDVTTQSKIGKSAPSYGLGVLTGDFDNDGKIDIYVANDSDASYLFWNQGDGTFEEGGMEAGVATNLDGRTQSGMGVSAIDYNGDGLLDIFKTNFSDDLPNLYGNRGKRFFEEDTKVAGLGMNSQYLGWGCGFLDIDNDGWPDILYVNGHVYPEIDRLGKSVGYRQPKILYRNRGNGKFEDVSKLSGPGILSLSSARGCAFGDFDNDGDVDVLINPINDLPELLRCDVPSGNHWVKLKLIGTTSNRSAIGARVRCVVNGHQQVDEVRSGGSFYSQNDLRLHFGLGKAKKADLVEVRWPTGKVQTLKDLDADRIWILKEGSGVEEFRKSSR